jgi:iron(III) transport system ATP-binding protein
MSATMIRLERVSKSFGPVRAVQDVTLEIGRGEFVALLGPSGCGKTTLLRLIAGFEIPDGGAVRLGEKVVAGSAWVPPERRHVGMVFQDYALFPHLTVAGNVGYGLPRAGRGVRVAETLALVGLAEHGDRYPHQLSGGQQQRVALARALAPEPALVLLDEPWSNIDPVLRTSMRDELAGILRATGVTVLLVTHEQEEAFSLADRVAVMRDGAIVQAGVPEEIYYAPATRWAAEFVGAANVLPGRLAGGLVETLVGRFPAPNGDGPGDVEVLVRPELLALNPDPAGEGEVVAREFRGHDIFYRVRLADGTTVCSQRPSNESIPLGARVALRPHVGRVALFH